MRTIRPAIDRFLSHIEQPDGPTGCWLWTAYRDRRGYGRFGADDSGPVLAHRWAYQHFVGPVAPGLDLDHLCRVHECVNPGHLEPLTRAQHARRSIYATKTHCKRGHEFTPENTYVWRVGLRACKACRKARLQPEGVAA